MEHYDYVIAGGGSAGCVLANRLSADPALSVLLIEAGGSDWHPFFHWPAGFAKMTRGIGSWGWNTVPQKHLQDRVLRFTQAKLIGGGSSINAQLYTRGAAADYDDWARTAGASGWSHADVLPYFKRSENNQRFANDYHSYGGPLGVSNPISPLPICEAFFQAGQELGIPFNPDFNGAAQDGLGYYQLTQLNARRSSAATGFLDPARGRANLKVRLHSRVLKVLLEGRRAVGVELLVGKSRTPVTVRARREVIVSSGAIGSPKLLMQSGIGPGAHLHSLGLAVQHELPGVGSNLQDHLDLFVIAECTGDHTYDKYNRPHHAAWAGLQYLLLHKGPVASSLFETGGFWYADPAHKARSPDIQFHLGLGSGIEAGMAKMRNAGVTLNTAYLRPQSRGSVRLASADPAAAPLIDPNYWAHPQDREMAIAGLQCAREIMRQPALQRYVRAEVLPGPGRQSAQELYAYACAHAKTDHHPVGTCRIGPESDAHSVVAPDLRLIGIDGLRVVDASVMPCLPSCNTNAPTIMLAEKAADHILGRI
ncbi:GMC family oxidoreductase [Verminephrobacter aporrectodeae]|uniref:Alanine-phosphoribitol ligase n=1 Tax=Verminephrobacter aporrectodeae subsp. tuberculatae TaxID=1110392 RepID=A0ABT3KPB6_9BURK|nr:GMC family oxidoreductase N-terminal domain-containing protein [Verminephrobacter aporrectodeae]MCW5220902.1 alanine-phosphoribitol ligase [Verminephrobacter aporrectodeae subsp. tuberculatae]MCW5290197.1 alanine-phosphoribitol ligase [Verminephrobacter aporrectodeae subsp. tuberculatae]MCW5320154.1 alanine-phosphoribitol ligase [Verminephrobacter aporrectodeae subsp. tuberculatae]MCW8174528.1 alanine-phosphoribitol ligase [Verminephrobacter aporrectodeae subsp. tuberculatae]MCW8202180.1 al